MNSRVLAVLFYVFFVQQSDCREQSDRRYEDLARKYEELKLKVELNTNRFKKLATALDILGSDLFGEDISKSGYTSTELPPVAYTQTPFQVNSVVVGHNDGVSNVTLNYNADDKLLVKTEYPFTDLQAVKNFQNGKGSATTTVTQDDSVGFLLLSPDQQWIFSARVPITNQSRTDQLPDMWMKANFSGELVFRKNGSITVSVRFPKVETSSEVRDYTVVCSMTVKDKRLANTVSEVSDTPGGSPHRSVLQTFMQDGPLKDYNEVIIRINGNHQDTSGLLMIHMSPIPKSFNSVITRVSLVYHLPVRRVDESGPFPADFLAFSFPPFFPHMTRCREGTLCVAPISLIGSNPKKVRLWKGKLKKNYFKNFRYVKFSPYRLMYTFYFPNISRHEGGNYTVKGRDLAGNTIRRKITLTVFEPHRFVLRSSKVIENLPNSLKVKCSVTGWPPADIAFRNSSIFDKQCIEYTEAENIHISSEVDENGLSTSVLHFSSAHDNVARVYCGVDNDVEKNGPSEAELLLYKNPNIDINDAVYTFVDQKHFTV